MSSSDIINAREVRKAWCRVRGQLHGKESNPYAELSSVSTVERINDLSSGISEAIVQDIFELYHETDSHILEAATQLARNASELLGMECWLELVDQPYGKALPPITWRNPLRPAIVLLDAAHGTIEAELEVLSEQG